MLTTLKPRGHVALPAGMRHWRVHPDGALLVSDDKAGVIYRIAYGE